MQFTKYDMFAYQLLDYFVTKHNYQIIRVQQHKDDIWLMNADQETYPVIRISSKSNDITGGDTEYIRNVHRVILNLIHREGPILILNTNPDSTPIENVSLTQIRITPKEISNEKILTIFHGLKEVVREREDVESEIATITKEIEEAELARHQKMLEAAKARSRPKVTVACMALCVGFSLLAYILMLFVQDDMAALVASGAYYKMNIISAYEYWRLLTAGFLHQDPVTLVLNLLILFYVGKSSEHLYKKWQFACIIAASIIMGNVFTLISEGNALSMGIGAAVFGMVGSYLVHMIANGAWKHSLAKFSAIKLMLIASFLILLQGLSLYAYLGGFVAGIVLGMLFSENKHLKNLKRHTAIASFILLLCSTFLVRYSSDIEPIDKEFDTTVVNIYRHTFLNKYAEYLQRCYNKQYRLE